MPKVKRLKQPDPTRYAPHDVRMQVLERDKYRCRYCRKPVTNDIANIDHVIPWIDRGPTTFENLVTACPFCNQKKSNRRQVEPLPIYPHNHEKHRRTGCRKPGCKSSHHDLQSILKRRPHRPMEVDLPDYLSAALGVACSHRASPSCKRMTCLEIRAAEIGDDRFIKFE